jgi:hypothetical protein
MGRGVAPLSDIEPHLLTAVEVYYDAEGEATMFCVSRRRARQRRLWVHRAWSTSPLSDALNRIHFDTEVTLH